jgi:polyisoprenyl-teichoic acid--peptidoglycan teichoic acid transferase
MSSSPEDIAPNPDQRSESAADTTGPGGASMPPRVSRREPYDTGETLPLESRRRGALEAPPRLSGEQQRRTRRRKAALTVVAVVAVVAVVVAVVLTLAWIRGLEGRLRFPASARQPLAHAITSVHSGEETYTVLALGVDGDPALQSQPLRALMLIRVTPAKVSALSLAPDVAVRPQVSQSPVQIPASETVPAVAALGDVANIGGYPAVVDTVERALGAPVNHVVVIRFSSIGKTVDALGGVWVSVPSAISDPRVTELTGAARVDAGKQLLDGAKSVSLVRALPEGETQVGLMARQRLFLNALVSTLASENSRLLGPRLAAQLADGMASDMSSRDLLALLARLRKAGPKVESASLWGSGQTGLKNLDPAATARLVRAFLSGSDLAKAGLKPPKGVRPSSVVVTVRNGSGASGLAAQAASILKAQGYRVRAVGNADQFVYDETLIVYKSNARAAAETIRKSLPVGRLVAGRGMYAFDTPVLVVIGKDWQNSAPKTDAVPIEQP